MSGGDDWQVGDLAECLAEGWQDVWPYNPMRGDILRVSKLGLFDSELALGFYGKPQRHGWQACAFRKIKPDAEPCEEEFTVLIKRMKPAKVPEVAV